MQLRKALLLSLFAIQLSGVTAMEEAPKVTLDQVDRVFMKARDLGLDIHGKEIDLRQPFLTDTTKKLESELGDLETTILKGLNQELNAGSQLFKENSADHRIVFAYLDGETYSFGFGPLFFEKGEITVNSEKQKVEVKGIFKEGYTALPIKVCLWYEGLTSDGIDFFEKNKEVLAP